MNLKPRFLLLAPLMIILAACSGVQSEPETLSQQLEGKSPEEKREILRLACLNEAEYTTDIKKSQHTRRHGARHRQMVKDTPETKNLKTICREMTDNYASGTNK